MPPMRPSERLETVIIRNLQFASQPGQFPRRTREETKLDCEWTKRTSPPITTACIYFPLCFSILNALPRYFVR